MSSLIRREPLDEALPLHRAMDRLFEDSLVRSRRSTAPGALALDMYETDEEIVIKADVAGVDPDDIQVTTVGTTVRIEGETKAETASEGKNYVFRERSYGRFYRALTLPDYADLKKAEAEFKHGVLTLTVPKAESSKPKSVSVKVK
jgi:HSP20 family protein